LLCAIALGWISELLLLLPGPQPPLQADRLAALSVHELHFTEGDPRSGAIQLRSLPGRSAAEQAAAAGDLPWAIMDTPVPVQVSTAAEAPELDLAYYTLSTSPAFCPPLADHLVPTLSRWIRGSRCVDLGPLRQDAGGVSPNVA
jgi:hypothetical protein